MTRPHNVSREVSKSSDFLLISAQTGVLGKRTAYSTRNLASDTNNSPVSASAFNKQLQNFNIKTTAFRNSKTSPSNKYIRSNTSNNNVRMLLS
jgi:hypothetical protein